MPRISKSSFLKGRQCARRIWLAAHGHREPEPDSDDVWREREAEGARVEELALSLFPGAERIVRALDDAEAEEGRLELDELLARTRTALARRASIAQAHLATDDLLAIADVLESRGDAWFVWEVKASTSHKPVFDRDLAFQVEVARRSGLDVAGAGVIRLDRSYARDGELDLDALLVREDRTHDVLALAAQVNAAIDEQLGALALRDVPAATPCPACKAYREAKDGTRPSTCGHLDRSGFCGRALPEHWAYELTDVTRSKRKLAAIERLPKPDLTRLDPDDAALDWSAKQVRMLRAARTGREQIDRGALRVELARLVFPVAYVDFEFDPGMAVPRFDGMHAYDALPFQWSVHVHRAPGVELEERPPFLHLASSDPRTAFAGSLLDALPASGTIVAHHASTEITVLRALADALGEPLASRLRTLDARFVDSIELLEAGYLHPSQHGSYSIKKVAPALLGHGYEDLALQNGMAAVMAWKEAIAPSTPRSRRDELARELRAYCGRDTELMHLIVERLRELAGSP